MLNQVLLLRGRYLLLLSLYVGVSCSPSGQRKEESTSSVITTPITQNESFTRLDLQHPPEDIPWDTVTITVTHDHSFEKEKRYLAIPFKPVLLHLLEKNRWKPEESEVVLICKDGYMPTESILDIYHHGGGYLAFRDLEQVQGAWDPEISEKYEPFYLVWEEVPYENKAMAWPYGLTEIELVRSDSMEQYLFPVYNAKVEKGYMLYRESCGKCHSVNSVGGIFGPEFNIPKNITEYWNRENIIAFAKDPASFRHKSKMPAVTHLTDEEFHQIVDYLEYIANHKKSL